MVELNRYARLAFTKWLGPGVAGMSGCQKYDLVMVQDHRDGKGEGGVVAGKPDLQDSIC